MKYFYTIALVLTLMTCNQAFAQDNNSSCNTQNLNLYNYIDYNELVQLSKDKDANKELSKKVDFILNNPIVDNSINCNSNTPLQVSPQIGPFIRIATWNIASPREAGNPEQLNDIKQIFTNPDSMLSKINTDNPKTIKIIKEQMDILRHSNIIVLNEIDAGMPRTAYKHEAEELAKAMGYNYTFVPEYLEVDPAHLGIQDYKWSKEHSLEKDGSIKNLVLNKSEYKGLHGSAILSQYPLENVRVLRIPQSYDWYYAEKKRISDLEDIKRIASEKVIKEYLLREIRVGSRIAIIADINIPGLSTPITIVSIHLENRTIPKKRAEEIQYVLDHIKNIKNPVILAGDFNTVCTDGSPTSIKKEIIKRAKDPNFIAKTIILYGNPYGLIINPVVSASAYLRRFSDPTVKSIPILAPNQEEEVFKNINNFKFSDNHTFDFRGIKSRSSGHYVGNLSDSNERIKMGFRSTFKLERSFKLGKYKLDWIFVKAYLDEPDDKDGSFMLAPHFGRTLDFMDYDLKEPPSDHTPITVDLPITNVKKIHTTKHKSHARISL